MQISEGVRLRQITPADNSSYHTKAEFINCFIIHLKYFQISKKDKMYFIVFCNTIIFAVNFNASKIKRLSFVAFPVFLLSVSFNKLIQQFFSSDLLSAIFALSSSSVPKPLVLDVNRSIIFDD